MVLSCFVVIRNKGKSCLPSIVSKFSRELTLSGEILRTTCNARKKLIYRDMVYLKFFSSKTVQTGEPWPNFNLILRRNNQVRENSVMFLNFSLFSKCNSASSRRMNKVGAKAAQIKTPDATLLNENNALKC